MTSTASSLALAAPRWRNRQTALAARAMRRHWTGLVGVVLLLLLILAAIAAPALTPYDPIATAFRQRLQPPSLAHPLGTDALGRDLLSRLLYGARISLRAGFLVVAISASLGTALGVIAGYYGRGVDMVIMRLADLWMAMPGILLAMVFIFTLGPSLTNVIIGVGLAAAPDYARLVRGSVLSAREQQYVDAARVIGAPDIVIMFRHILPNVIAPIMIVATLGIGSAILGVAGLSFLGLGAQPPTPEWGVIISDGRDKLRTAWWISTFAGGAIMISVLAINLVGDALRDALDPRLRAR
jgi:peptide/nickel transport system permease protein